MVNLVHCVSSKKQEVGCLEEGLGKRGISLMRLPFDLEEGHNSSESIATLKARKAFSKIEKPVVVEEVGFFVPSSCFPQGIFQKSLNKENFSELIKSLDSVYNYCYFDTCLAYLDKGLRDPEIFKKISEGMLVKISRGSSHDPFIHNHFIPLGDELPQCCRNKTLFEISEEGNYKLYEEEHLRFYAALANFIKSR